MLLIIGDIHWKKNLGYAEQIRNNRKRERKEILDFIIKQAEDCDSVVFLGDQMHSRNNPSSVIADFTKFVERFGDKKLYMIAGNHEKLASGETSLDYLKEIKGKKWHIITRDVEVIDGMAFLPYLTKAELEAKDNKEALKIILEKLKPANILFHHHCMTKDDKNVLGLGVKIKDMDEPVLPTKELLKKYKFIAAGHIHSPLNDSKETLISGSIFTNAIGEKEKFIWKLDEKTLELTSHKLPTRRLIKLEDPAEEEIKKILKDDIVRVDITRPLSSIKINELKEELKKKVGENGAFIVIEKIPRKRKKLHFSSEESLLDFNIDKLLEVYAKEKKIDLKILKRGYDLIKD